MKKTLPGYMSKALYHEFGFVPLNPEVEVRKFSEWVIVAEEDLNKTYNRLEGIIIRFRTVLQLTPKALRKWAEDDPDIKRILVEVEL